MPGALGRVLAAAFAENGADVRESRVVAHLARHVDGTGFTATLDDGACVDAGLILSAVGLVPETDKVASGVVVSFGAQGHRLVLNPLHDILGPEEGA